MTLPALFFGFCTSTFLGAAFHLWKDGGLYRLVLYFILSWVGFCAGHLLEQKLGWNILSVGPLHLGMAILGSIFLLVLGHWLTSTQAEK